MKIDEVRIRNVDVTALSKISQIAKKKGMSRNTYLKKQIETLSVVHELKEQEDRYISLVNLLTEVIEENTREFTRLRELVEERI